MGRKKKTRLPECVTKLTDGRYRVRVTMADPETGKRIPRKKTLPHGSTEAQAVAVRDRLREALRAGVEAPTGATPSVTDYVPVWLYSKGARVSARTLSGYTSSLAWPIERFGRLSLAKVTRAVLERFVGYLERDSGLAPRSQRVIWARTKAMLRDGWADHDLAPPRGLDRVQAPRGTAEPAGRAMSSEELAAFIRTAREHPDMEGEHARLACELFAVTGIRRVELARGRLADLDGTILTVRSAKGGRRRLVALEQDFADRLGAWGRRAQILTGNLDVALVTRPDGRNAPYNLHWRWVSTCAVLAGLPHVSPHDLRRTMNTLGLQAGVPVDLLRAWMGHTTSAMTALYHRPSADAATVVREGVFGETKGGSKK